MRFLITILLVSSSALCFSQQKILPLNQQFNTWEEANFNRTDNKVHTSIRPILESDFNYDSLRIAQQTNRKERSRWLGKKLKTEHFIPINQDDFQFSIDPVINMERGKEQSLLTDTTQLYKNTRGILVRGDIGKHVSFSTSFYESQAFFPSYVDAYARKTNTDPLYPNYGIVPGQGRAKSFKNGGFDYGMSSANVSYSASTYFNFQMGYGKNFIGEGYRSMLLSDVAFNYPFIKFTTKIGKNKKWQYSNIYSSLKQMDRVPTTIATEQQYITKGGVFHYLSWIPIDGIQIGFFEGTIIETWNADSAHSQPINPLSFTPIIGVNSIVNGTNGKNNTILGLNLKITPVNYISLYGQFVFDAVNKYAYQAGLKMYNFGGLIQNVSLRLEYNSATPYTYSHRQPIQNYSHYGQPLAHIYGAGFREGIAILNYNFKDFFVQAKYILITSLEGEDAYNWGVNIFKPTETPLPISTTTSFKLTMRYIDFQLGYMVNPNYNMNVVLGVTSRNLGGGNPVNENTSSTYMYVSLRTSLRNLYYDF